ncbi:MAG: hypothetical protein WC835_01620 [Candidatus Paceibacterota bacterium]|jgi:hypothetical protein
MNIELLKDEVRLPFFASGIQAAFFAAMMNGYAGEDKPKKGTIVELPGSKTIIFTHGRFEIKDVYLTNKLGCQSGGMTGVFCDGVPVWMMLYGGEYPDEAVPCLKAALRSSYAAERFDGGRGPMFFQHEDGRRYVNDVDKGSSFAHFSGKERVFSPDGREIGSHQYHGFLMTGR